MQRAGRALRPVAGIAILDSPASPPSPGWRHPEASPSTSGCTAAPQPAARPGRAAPHHRCHRPPRATPAPRHALASAAAGLSCQQAARQRHGIGGVLQERYGAFGHLKAVEANAHLPRQPPLRSTTHCRAAAAPLELLGLSQPSSLPFRSFRLTSPPCVTISLPALADWLRPSAQGQVPRASNTTLLAAQ